MKWVKFLSEDDGRKALEVAQIDDTEYAVLKRLKVVEDHPEPKEVADAAVNDPSLKTFVAGIASDFRKELKDAFTAEAKGVKSKRPVYDVRTHDNADDDPTFGFKSCNEQVRAVRDWYMGRRQDERLERYVKSMSDASTKAPTSYASEGLGADGGFLLAPQFEQTLLKHTFTDESLLAKCRQFTTSSNNLTIPKDETTPWGSSGVQVYWANEAAQYTQSKPQLGQDTLLLHKLTALVPVTDEMLQDSFMGLGQYVTEMGGERIRWKCDEAIVNGTGAGQPLGFATAPALVAQAKESGQAANTISLANIANMLSRVPPQNMKNLVWLIHPKTFPQIVTLTNGNSSLWVAAGNVQTAGYLGTLFGIPVIISQHCQTLSSQGDIYLVDFSSYLAVTKGTGVETAMSIHLYFDYSVSTFRLNFRVAGQPWLAAPITSAYGSYTMSPFVTLASR